MRLAIRPRSAAAEARCPLCMEEIDGSAERIRGCWGCGTLVHMACFSELGGDCPTLGCPGPRVPRLRPRLRPRSNTTGEAWSRLRWWLGGGYDLQVLRGFQWAFLLFTTLLFIAGIGAVLEGRCSPGMLSGAITFLVLCSCLGIVLRWVAIPQREMEPADLITPLACLFLLLAAYVVGGG